ncbi:MAG: homogentisate 1,2-dioxygenase [Bdellovibrionales bacterium]|nr:homogentisate 1,2-dioxygenase [Bdellovibrionales bacterium]
MDIPYVRGRTPKQAHVDIPEGTYEEEVGRNGFFGKYAHLYRSHPPVNWTRIEGPLKPQLFDLNQLKSEGDYSSTRDPILWNDDVAIYQYQMNKAMEYYFRNADADEILFVHKGYGNLETDYGVLNYKVGDYILIPRGTLYRLVPSDMSQFLIVESFSEVEFPHKGMLGQHALFDPAVLTRPDLNDGPISSLQSKNGEYEIRVKRTGEITKIFYPHCPLDVVGWKGTLSPILLNVEDIRPVLSDRYHLPPSAHSTFVANNFVICTFLPRPLEIGDEGAMKVPFYHSNIDFDEVLFYHAGDFFSRDGISEGMMTFHPQGIHHGPQKKAIERSKNATKTNEIAVMIDTKRPLKVGRAGESVENKNYWKSWQE